MKKQGIVTLVGAGPGDELLITRKGFHALEDAEVLVYDSLSSDAFLKYVPETCETIYVGKRCGHHSMKQEEINALLVEKGLEGKKVVRLKGGDPFVFGRGGEEILALKEHGILYEVIPGVTSAVAAPAYAGIPVTHRGMSRSFHVITGHTASSDHPLTDNLETLAKLEGTLVFLMGLNHLSEIVEGLMEKGKPSDTPVALIENGTLPNQRKVTGTLSTIVEQARVHQVVSPALIVIGQVAFLSMESTKEPLSLEGMTVGVTGTQSMVEKLTARLEAEGASIYPCPFLKLVTHPELLDEPFSNLQRYDWVIFTSSNAIRIFFAHLKKRKIDIRSISHLKYAVIGTGTGNELVKHGIYADFVPSEFTTKVLAEEFVKSAGKNQRVLIPRAVKGSKFLTDFLKRKKVEFDEIPVYDIEADKTRLNQFCNQIKKCDIITFESSSGVEGFFQLQNAKELLKQVTPVCIGEVTADTLKKKGVDKMLTGEDNTIEGIVSCLKSKKKQ